MKDILNIELADLLSIAGLGENKFVGFISNMGTIPLPGHTHTNVLHTETGKVFQKVFPDLNMEYGAYLAQHRPGMAHEVWFSKKYPGVFAFALFPTWNCLSQYPVTGTAGGYAPPVDPQLAKKSTILLRGIAVCHPENEYFVPDFTRETSCAPLPKLWRNRNNITIYAKP